MHFSMIAYLLVLCASAPEANNATDIPANRTVESMFAAFILAPPCDLSCLRFISTDVCAWAAANEPRPRLDQDCGRASSFTSQVHLLRQCSIDPVRYLRFYVARRVVPRAMQIR